MLKFLIPIVTITMMKTLYSRFTFSLIILSFNLTLQKTMTSKISYLFMGDVLSFWMVNLSLWLLLILMFKKISKSKIFFKVITLMAIILTMTFFCWNFLAFYILFELSLIIILMVIMMWGYQPERVEAMLFMIMLTVLVSLPFLASMFMNLASLNFWLIHPTLNLWTYLSFSLIFMMKLPIFFLHVWLPKMHVESPIHGSMILAAILLKLGSYGLMRTSTMFQPINSKIKSLTVAFSFWTIILVSMICLMQVDLKTVIAYSSICHMTLVFLTILLNKDSGMKGSLMIMIGHGMTSSSLFMMANFMYQSTKSRSTLLNQGIMIHSPTATLMWFIACLNNVPMPPSLNMVGEFFCYKTLVDWSISVYSLIVLLILSTSMYSIYLLFIPIHGNLTKTLSKAKPASAKLSMICLMHIIPLIFIPMKIQILGT